MGLGTKAPIRRGGLIYKNTNKSSNKHGTLSEKRVAKDLGMKLTPGSGALSGAKGDAYNIDYRMESKSTIKESLSLKRAWLTKINNEARETNRHPALSLSFVNPDGSPKHNGDWVMIPKEDFEEFLELLNEFRQ